MYKDLTTWDAKPQACCFPRVVSGGLDRLFLASTRVQTEGYSLAVDTGQTAPARRALNIMKTRRVAEVLKTCERTPTNASPHLSIPARVSGSELWRAPETPRGCKAGDNPSPRWPTSKDASDHYRCALAPVLAHVPYVLLHELFL